MRTGQGPWSDAQGRWAFVCTVSGFSAEGVGGMGSGPIWWWQNTAAHVGGILGCVGVNWRKQKGRGLRRREGVEENRDTRKKDPKEKVLSHSLPVEPLQTTWDDCFSFLCTPAGFPLAGSLNALKLLFKIIGVLKNCFNKAKTSDSLVTSFPLWCPLCRCSWFSSLSAALT